MGTDIVELPVAVIDGRNYALGTALKPADPIVADARATVVKTLTVDKLISNMRLAADQLNVAHLASAKYPIIQNQVWQILADLQIAVGKSDATMIVIGNQAQNILDNLSAAFDYMFSGDFGYAATILMDCGDCASKLAQAAEDMAVLYDGLATQVRGVVTTAQTTSAEEQDLIAELQKTLDENAATLAQLKVDKEQYALQKAKVQKLYEETKAAAETAEERAFVSELVGGIFSAVGSGLAAYASAKTPSIKIGSDVVPAGQSIGGGETAAKKPAPNDTKDEDPVVPPKASAKASETPEKGAGTGDAKTEGDDKAKGEGEGKTEGEAGAGGTASKPASTMSEAEKLAQTKAAAAAAQDISSRADKMAESAASSAIELRKQVGQLLNMEFEIAEKQRGILGQIAKYTSLMQSQGAKQSAIEIAVASLGQSIAALQSVAAILIEAATFWRAMEAKCNSLSADDGFLKSVKRLEANRTPEQIQSDVRKPTFVKGAIQYVAGWTALENIAADYRTELGNLGRQVKGYVSQHPSEEKARQMAMELAKKLGMDVGELIAAEERKAKRAEEFQKLIADDTEAEAA